MKKLGAILVCVLLIAALAIPAMAAGTTTFTITPDKTSVAPGEEVTFTVTINGSDAVKSLGLQLKYDQNAFEMVSGECTLPCWMPVFDADKGFAVLFMSDTVPSGTLGTFTLKAIAECPTTSVVTGITSVKSGSTTFESTVNSVNIAISGDHSWNAGEVTTAPGCETTGVKTYTCVDCGDTKTEAVAATGHNYDAGTVTTAPGCETKGVKTYTCKNNASHTKTEAVDAIGHDWNEGSVTTAPGCVTEGVKTYTCKNDASHTKTEAVAAVGHTPSADSVISKEPTCEETGLATGSCSVCEEKLTDEVLPALGHDYELTATVDPTCEVAGSETYTCKNDASHTKTEEIAALGHDYKLTATVEPTCEVDGSETYTCENDASHTKTEVLPATGHTYETYEQTETGHIGTCACGAVSEEEEHEYSIDGDVLVKPTTTTDGKQEKLCVCGAKTVVSIPKEDAKLDDVPKNGDITGELAMGAMVIVAMCAAVAFVFKRKAAK